MDYDHTTVPPPRGGSGLTQADERRWVVIDDDPTGTQAVTGAKILLEWTPVEIAAALVETRRPVHLLTNSRAFAPARARELVREAVVAALAADPDAQVLLRGDSTLRAHLLEEFLGVADAMALPSPPVLLLVPALPAAGRVTVGGVHFLERDGVRTPLHETEYAQDPALGYTTARLVEWAEQRSGGFFVRRHAYEVPLERLRREGGRAVRDALTAGAAEAPAVVAPDAVTLADLKSVAEGLKGAVDSGLAVVTRCAPTFVGIIGGHLATAELAPPRGRRVLVACGSFVSTSTRQLESLLARYPHSLVTLDPSAAASDDGGALAAAEAAAEASRLLDSGPLAVVATDRPPDVGTTFETAFAVAEMLARTVAAIDPPPDVVIGKGGITSAVIAEVGLTARAASVLGPVAAGVALWRVDDLPYVVFPGNVGSDTALAELVDRVLDQPQEAAWSSR